METNSPPTARSRRRDLETFLVEWKLDVRLILEPGSSPLKPS